MKVYYLHRDVIVTIKNVFKGEIQVVCLLHTLNLCVDIYLFREKSVNFFVRLFW